VVRGVIPVTFLLLLLLLSSAAWRLLLRSPLK
jgi:hypothetical protein